jgi:hypothetical protein
MKDALFWESRDSEYLLYRQYSGSGYSKMRVCVHYLAVAICVLIYQHYHVACGFHGYLLIKGAEPPVNTTSSVNDVASYPGLIFRDRPMIDCEANGYTAAVRACSLHHPYARLREKRFRFFLDVFTIASAWCSEIPQVGETGQLVIACCLY